MDADTGKELLQDGKPVTSEKHLRGKTQKTGLQWNLMLIQENFRGKEL